jgi:hypothetical protein
LWITSRSARWFSLHRRPFAAADGDLLQRESAGAVAHSEKIEALLPTNLGRVAESASYWRNHLKI